MEPMLYFFVSNQIITREKPFFYVVADSKNYLYAKFDFKTPEWNGVHKTAIFEAKGKRYTVILENDMCLVPWEWLEQVGGNYVSVFGGDLITTNRAFVCVHPSGYGEGKVTNPPTPDAYNQVMVKLDKKADGIAITGDTIRLFSGEEVVYETQFNIDGGNFLDWGDTNGDTT